MADKKSSKSKKAKKIEVVIPEETEYDRMDLEMLREVVPMLKQQLEKSMLDRNYVQLERDSIQQFFEITKREVEETELLYKSKEREIETLENNHRVTLRVYEQKVKHLEYDHDLKMKELNEIVNDHTNNTNTNSRSNKMNMEASQATLLSQELLDTELQSHLIQMKDHLKVIKLETELNNLQQINDIQLQQEQYLFNLSQQFDAGLNELKLRCETRQNTIELEYELRRRVDIHEVEERKNMHIHELLLNHNKSFQSMKEYYNKITSENLNLIKNLQSQVRELKSRSETNKATLLQYKIENDTLNENSIKENERLKVLQAQLRQRQNDKLAYKNAMSRVTDLEKKFKKSNEELLELRQEYEEVEKEYQELTESFDEILNKTRNQSNEMNTTLERKLQQLQEAQEKYKQEMLHKKQHENTNEVKPETESAANANNNTLSSSINNINRNQVIKASTVRPIKDTDSIDNTSNSINNTTSNININNNNNKKVVKNFNKTAPI